MNGAPTINALMQRLARIESLSRPPPTEQQIIEARRIEAEIEALRAMTTMKRFSARKSKSFGAHKQDFMLVFDAWRPRAVG